MIRAAVLGQTSIFTDLFRVGGDDTPLIPSTFGSIADLAPAMSVHDIDVVIICDDEQGRLTRGVRAQFPTADIIALRSQANVVQRVRCLEQGADVCLLKQTSPDELIATINSLLRRRTAATLPTRAKWTVLFPEKHLVTPSGAPIILTPTELQIMLQLAEAFPMPATRRQLIESMGQDYLTFDERRLEAMISRLRHKLPQHGDTPSPIRHARGKGYFFSDPIEVVGAQLMSRAPATTESSSTHHHQPV